MNKNTGHEEILGILLGFWLFLNVIPFINGLCNANDGINYPALTDRCALKAGKIEYVFPGYQLGCYMGKPFGDDK